MEQVARVGPGTESPVTFFAQFDRSTFKSVIITNYHSFFAIKYWDLSWHRIKNLLLLTFFLIFDKFKVEDQITLFAAK